MKKLLVIVDMQKDFVTGVLGTKEAQAIVAPLADYATKFDGDIVFTRDTHDENYLNTQEGRKLPVVHCIERTPGWELVDELIGISNGPSTYDVFDKPTFGSIELANLVATRKYDAVEFCGVCTGICVISNVLMTKTFSRETSISVLSNLCACVTPESHQTALNAMATCQVEIREV